MSIRIGINGFGRIGRNSMRAIAATDTDVEVVAVNDLTDPGTLAHLLKYDSVHGRFSGSVTLEGDQMVVDGAPVKVLAERDPAKLPWKDLSVDVAHTSLRSTGPLELCLISYCISDMPRVVTLSWSPPSKV